MFNFVKNKKIINLKKAIEIYLQRNKENIKSIVENSESINKF